MSRNSVRGRRWGMVRLLMMQRANWRCEKCHGSGRLEVHHKVPIREGGARFDPMNLRVLCRRCHFEEHDTDTPPGRKGWRRLVREAMSDA